MLEILGGLFLIGLIVALAFAGVAATTIAVIAVVCLVIAGVVGLALGTAVLLFKLLVAVLLALALQFIFVRVLTAIGDRARIDALRESASVNRIAWILSGVTTGYLYFIR